MLRGVRPIGRLVDVNHLVNLGKADDFFVLSRAIFAVMKVFCRGLVKNFVDEAALAAAGDARHGHGKPHGKLYIDVFQIVFLAP